MERVFNFAPGPSTLPAEVVQRMTQDVAEYRGCGCSVLELTHRGALFTEIFNDARATLARLLSVPEDYEILFMQGGGRMQFEMVPLNFALPGKRAAFIVNGIWSEKAAAEAMRFTETAVAAHGDGCGCPDADQIRVPEDASYLYYCDNETVGGMEFGYVPESRGVPLVTDMSSNILTRPVDVKRFGAIWFGAQKNAGIPGLSIVIVRRDLLGRAGKQCPLMLNWKHYADTGSMPNTAPTFAIYAAGLMFRWVEKEGGVTEMARRAAKRSKRLYDVIDGSAGFYRSRIRPDSRSRTNVTFRLPTEALEERLIADAAAAGIINIRGHRSAGGLRASVYNAMPDEGVERLAALMQDFEKRHG